uniref:ascorbate ferrireductase (transmembrane) n=1 Tax=Anopheles farauti TaxID=69004 RepID=A0A182QGU3_9DIPT
MYIMQILLVEEDDADETQVRDSTQCTVLVKCVVFGFIYPTCVIFATVSIILTCWWNGKSNFYIWHVLLTGIGFIVLMATGIFILRGHRLVQRATYTTRRTIHWIVQSIAVAFILTGTVLQYINREMKHKHHFTSAHSIVGLVSVAFIVVSLASGMVALFGWELRKRLKPLWSKRLHRAAGVVGFLAGIAALGLAYDKHIFKEYLSKDVRLALLGTTVLTALICLMGVLKKVYNYFWETCTFCSNENLILDCSDD